MLKREMPRRYVTACKGVVLVENGKYRSMLWLAGGAIVASCEQGPCLGVGSFWRVRGDKRVSTDVRPDEMIQCVAYVVDFVHLIDKARYS